jgi:hypothetical protein
MLRARTLQSNIGGEAVIKISMMCASLPKPAG